MTTKKTLEKKEETEVILPLKLGKYTIKIVGISSLIVHAWDEKAKQMMLDKQMKKTVTKGIRDPQSEYEACFYKLENGGFGFPVDGLKKSIVSAGDKDKDKNLAKTRLRRAFFIEADDISSNGYVPCVKIHGGTPRMRQDMVKIGIDTSDLRFRPEFINWSMYLKIILDLEMLSVNQLINLIEKGGFGVGIGEWRPERDGQFGRYTVDTFNPT